jgi:hypothetical protein
VSVNAEQRHSQLVAGGDSLESIAAELAARIAHARTAYESGGLSASDAVASISAALGEVDERASTTLKDRIASTRAELARLELSVQRIPDQAGVEKFGQGDLGDWARWLTRRLVVATLTVVLVQSCHGETQLPYGVAFTLTGLGFLLTNFFKTFDMTTSVGVLIGGVIGWVLTEAINLPWWTALLPPPIAVWLLGRREIADARIHLADRRALEREIEGCRARLKAETDRARAAGIFV